MLRLLHILVLAALAVTGMIDGEGVVVAIYVSAAVIVSNMPGEGK